VFHLRPSVFWERGAGSGTPPPTPESAEGLGGLLTAPCSPLLFYNTTVIVALGGPSPALLTAVTRKFRLTPRG
jgi:hypothetical protein